MSTENQPVQDQNPLPSTPETPSAPAVQEPAAEGAALPESPAIPATEVPVSEGIEEPKKKLQLNPIALSDEVKAVPSLGESTAPPAAAEVPATPVEPSRPAPPPPPREAVPLPQVEAIDDALAADIEAAMAGAGDATIPVPSSSAEALNIETLQAGHKLKGVVQGVHGDSVFVDVNLRMTAAVPFRQFDVKKPPQIGDEIEIAFDKVDEAEGLILANLPRGTTVVKGGDWSAVSVDQVVECVVTKTNKGGLEATVGTLRGFIPASQVDLGYIADLQQFVGQKLRVRITEVNPAKKKLVFSRRVLLQEEREVAKGQLLEEIKPDQTRTGRVKSIKEYGAFVDLGGMDGFLPIGQLSWVRIEHPSEVLQEGQEIEVKVLSVDREKNRISLGMRQLAPNPWRSAESKYAKGTTATGRVTRVEAFGAFIELEPGVEGLVHISELEHRRVKRVEEVLNVGDMAEVQILEVDPKKKRISLSAKALKEAPAPVVKPTDEDLAPGKGEAYQRKRKDGLKGGTGSGKSGGLFGNPTDF
ncbi:30S ribosomal protein S1 [Planctomicrobium sp. SH661]|uniref:30S ribosomal protein S1 n=1 Tax=Planctomicrobium sp. SH661 TaxID=3448124 RepID=UPI003F5BE83C